MADGSAFTLKWYNLASGRRLDMPLISLLEQWATAGGIAFRTIGDRYQKQHVQWLITLIPLVVILATCGPEAILLAISSARFNHALASYSSLMAVFEARGAAWTPVDGNDWAYVERLLPLWDSLSGSLVTYGRVFKIGRAHV